MNFNILIDKLIKYFSDDSNFCVANGLDHNLGSLPDPGKNKLIQKQGQLRLLTRITDGFDKSTLNENQKIDFKLIELLIERENVRYETEIDGVLDIFKKPNAASTIFDPLYTLLVNDEREPKYRLVNIISKVKCIPEFLISLQRNLNKPVERWVNIEIESLSSFDDFFKSVLAFAKENNFKNLALVQDVFSKAKSSIDRYINFLKICEKSSNIHIGLEQTKRVIKSNGIDLSVDEIHSIACSFIKNNLKSIDSLKDELVLKYKLDNSISNQDLQSFLNEKFKTSNVLGQYEKEEKELKSFIKASELVDLSIDESIDIIKTPGFMKNLIPAGAMCPPLPLREGHKKSLIFLTIDKNNSSDHNLLTIPPMLIHEAYPGHHLQFSYACSNDSRIRRIFQANDLSEGWATYLEEYLLDLGYKSEFQLEMKYIVKRDIARIGARVGIDLYFMTGDIKYLDLNLGLSFESSDPFENAKKLLIHITGFSSTRADGELNWYSMERGYPMTYLVGNHLLLSLKAKTKLSDLEFHQIILECGNIPLSLLNI